MQSMRITQIMLGKGFGGAERSFVDTALALAGRGHEVQAICHRKFVKRALLEEVAGIQLECISAGGQWDILTPRRIAKLIRNFQPEIVHTQLKRAAWHGGRAGYLAGVPVVSKLHNYVGLERYRYVHTLIGTTEDQRRYALEHGWPQDRVAVIPNFSRVEPVASARRVPEAPFRFLSYGRYVHVKGYDILLRAFRQVLDAGVDAQLIIGGGGEESAKLNKLVNELGMQDKVQLDVWIDDTEKALDACDIFVLSSRSESFGIVLLETMARGVPIVSTKAKGPQQVLDDSTAWFAELESVDSLAQAMLSAVHAPDAASAKAEAALQAYKSTYYVNTVLPQLERLYATVSAQVRQEQ